MTIIWKPPSLSPTLTVIDLNEKNKKFVAAQLRSADDLVRYLSRTIGRDLGAGDDLEMLSRSIARDGAVWVEGINFHSKKFAAMIEEFDLAARAHPRANLNPFGLLVLSTSKSSLPKSVQMEKLKGAGPLALKLLGVDQNRAFLAIHDDTDNLHLHMIYCRFDSSGRLTEREAGKFRRYLMEDLTARLAFDLGYRLEFGARTKPSDQGDLIDRISGSVVRDANFEPVMAGCKARNRQRRELGKGHKLETLVVSAYWKSLGDLARFREILASEGIAFCNKRGGAVVVDADGTTHSASSVHPCLRRGKIFGGRYKNCIPPEAPGLSRKREDCAQFSNSHTSSATGEDAPSYAGATNLTLEQRQEADRRLGRGYSDARPGAPRKIDMGTWPSGFPWGGIRAPTAVGAAFKQLGITARDRDHHLELWRNDRLIAVQRSDQIVVYTRDKEDLRDLLLAAHKQWANIELTGNSKFKARLADLAAELDIPIMNPELERRIGKRRDELERAQERAVAALAWFQAEGFAPPSAAVESILSEQDRNAETVPPSILGCGQASSTLSAASQQVRTPHPQVNDRHGPQFKLDGAASSSTSLGAPAPPDTAPVSTSSAAMPAAKGDDRLAEKLTFAAGPVGSKQPLGRQPQPKAPVAAIEEPKGSDGLPEERPLSKSGSVTSAADDERSKPMPLRTQPPAPDQIGPARDESAVKIAARAATALPGLDERARTNTPIVDPAGLVGPRDRSENDRAESRQVQVETNRAADGRIPVDRLSLPASIPIPPASPTSTALQPGERAGTPAQNDGDDSHRPVDRATSLPNDSAKTGKQHRLPPTEVPRIACPSPDLESDGGSKRNASPTDAASDLSPLASGKEQTEAEAPPIVKVGTFSTEAKLPTDEPVSGDTSASAPLAVSETQPSVSRSPFMKLLGRKKIELGPVRWLALRDAIDRFQKPAPGAERDRLAYTINLALDVKVANRLNYPELARVFAASNRHLELMKNQDAQRTIRGRG